MTYHTRRKSDVKGVFRPGDIVEYKLRNGEKNWATGRIDSIPLLKTAISYALVFHDFGLANCFNLLKSPAI
jgi:hypothetical protein